MLTAARKTSIDKHQTHNKRMLMAILFAAGVGSIAFNLDLAGSWLMQLGRPNLATPCYQVMTSMSRNLHIQDARTGDALTQLGICYAKENRTDDAIEMQQRAIAAYKESLGEDSTQVFLGTANIANYLNSKGNYLRAEMILNEAVQGLERKAIGDTEATAVIYASLTDTLIRQDKTYQALAVLEKLLPIDERYMMLKHKSVDSYDKLAHLYAKLGRMNLSKQTMEHGISIKERILGADDVQVATSHQKLLKLEQAKGPGPTGAFPSN